MATRAQQAQLLRNQNFQDQVEGALLAAAFNVINESPDAPNHRNRLAWANAIYTNPTAQMKFFLPGMLTNPTVAAEAGKAAGDSGSPVTDSDVDYVVASLFDIYANQYAMQFRTGAALTLGG
jgi:hypothetical protein